MKPKNTLLAKSNLIRLFFVAIMLLILIVKTNGQTQWTKYANNPVITKGPELWDIIAIGQPTVLFENDTIKMWYAGVGSDMKGRICYATSTDGINWNKYNNPVIDVGSQGEWDSGWLDTPEILKDDNEYKMYYYGDTVQQNAAYSSAIGLAHSPDGINWTKDPNNPIFTKANFGDWDGTWVESPALFWDSINGDYVMWYNGVDTNTWKIQIGLATSLDGINWIRHSGNPILSSGFWGEYDDMWLGTPAVIYNSGKFEMWYSAACSESYNPVFAKFDTLRICYASSDNGINWTKYPGNPLFETFTAPYDSLIDTYGPWAPDVIFDTNANEYKMWFESEGGFSLVTALVTLSGIKENESFSNSLIISPNPFSSLTKIKTTKPLYNATVTIYNSMGQVVESMKNINSSEVQIERKGLSAGIYLLQLTEGNILQTSRLIIE